jgi:Ice-binding-like/Fn3 associated
MKISTKNPQTVLNLWTRFLGALLTGALMVLSVAAFSQSAPVLNLPVDAAVNVSTSPTLIFVGTAGDSVYHLQIDTSNVFGTTVYNDSTLTGVSDTITGLRNATKYYWRVSVKDSANAGGGTSAYSTIRSFTTWNSTPTTPLLPVTLGSTGGFAILSYAGITNTGPTSITGDVGVTPLAGSYMTGFDHTNVVGTIYGVDATGPTGSVAAATMLTQAMGDLTIAYNDAAGRTVDPIGVSGNLGGRTLYSGLYKSTGTLEITSGDLTLDAQGDSNAVWIFQIASSFNMTNGRQVFLSGGAQASNVFWQAGSGATFGTNCVMKGTILVYTNITFATGASLEGRALARTASVTLQSNTIVRPIRVATKVATPSITPNAGSFTDSVIVTLACVTSNVQIYYTLNDSTPDNTKTLYSAPFTLKATTTVKVRAYKLNSTKSDSVMAIFTKLGSMASNHNGLSPQKFAFIQNYANRSIEFTVPSNGKTTLTVYNTIGQEVATLFNGEAEAGRYNHVQFNTSGLAKGLYFSKLEFNGNVTLKEMMLVK